jgi:hypothetical protein
MDYNPMMLFDAAETTRKGHRVSATTKTDHPGRME